MVVEDKRGKGVKIEGKKENIYIREYFGKVIYIMSLYLYSFSLILIFVAINSFHLRLKNKFIKSSAIKVLSFIDIIETKFAPKRFLRTELYFSVFCRIKAFNL